MAKPCKYCGSTLHFSYQCFKNPNRGKTLKRRYEKAYKTGEVGKHDKVLNSQSLNRKRLVMELDKYCSLIVRISASDKYGVATCYTCGKRLPWKCMHNCHFKSRQFLGTRFDFDNMRCGCPDCNIIKHGNISVYRERLKREIGEDKVNNLDKKKGYKYSTVELKEMLDDLKLKYKQVVEEKRKLNLL